LPPFLLVFSAANDGFVGKRWMATMDAEIMRVQHLPGAGI
jgi:hypothetical protein